MKSKLKICLLTKSDFWCEIVRRFIIENFEDPLIIVGDYRNWNYDNLDLMVTWEGDYIISYNSPWIVPETLLKKAKIAAINFHPGSPNYPGRGCYNFAIWDDVKSYGCTCHYMLPKVDSGTIIRTISFPLFKNETIESLKEKTMSHMLCLFYEIMDYVLYDIPLRGNGEEWSRNPFTLKEFQELCDFTGKNNDIDRRIRATYYPYGPDYPYIKIGKYKFEYKGKKI